MLVSIGLGSTIARSVTAGTGVAQAVSIAALLSEQEATGNFMPSKLSVQPREITAFVGRGNGHSVSIGYDNAPLPLDQFYRFQLVLNDRDITIDTQFNPGAIVGQSDGTLMMDIADFITRVGTIKTTLIAYSNTEPAGVILWEQTLANASLTINARRA